MPHVIVKLWPGKSEQQKQRPADQIAKDVMNVLNYGEESVSVAIEEIPAKEWLRRSTNPKSLRTRRRCTRNRDTICLNYHEVHWSWWEHLRREEDSYEATVMYGAGDLRLENVPDAKLIDPTDTLVKVTRGVGPFARAESAN